MLSDLEKGDFGLPKMFCTDGSHVLLLLQYIENKECQDVLLALLALITKASLHTLPHMESLFWCRAFGISPVYPYHFGRCVGTSTGLHMVKPIKF